MTRQVYKAKILPLLSAENHPSEKESVWYQIGIGVAGPKGILVTLFTVPTQPGPIQFQLFPVEARTP